MTDSTSPQPRRRILHSSPLICAAATVALLGWAWFLYAYLHTHAIGVLGLFPNDKPYEDFYVYKWTFVVYHRPEFFQPTPGRSGFAYPPFLALFYRFFYRHQHQITWYFLCTAALWGALLFWAGRIYRCLPFAPRRLAAVLAAPLLCYPAIFLLERGNLEVVVWYAVAMGVFLFTIKRDLPSGICFGLAAALKLYPVLLLGLFLSKKGWWQPVLAGLATATAVTLFAIAYTGPTFQMAAHGFFLGITGFQQHYGVAVRSAELRFDHSFFSVFKAIAGIHGHSAGASLPFYYLGGALLFTTLFFSRVRFLPVPNRVLFLTACMLLLPPVSYEYTLVHLYLPFLLIAFALARSGDRPSVAGLGVLITVLALLLPLDLFPTLFGMQAGQWQAFLLLFLAVLAAFPFGVVAVPLAETHSTGNMATGAASSRW